MQTRSIEVFAEEINSAAKVLTAFSASSGHLSPSYNDASSSAVDVLPSSAPSEVQIARQVILENAYRLQQLLTEPTQYLARLAIYVSGMKC